MQGYGHYYGECFSGDQSHGYSCCDLLGGCCYHYGFGGHQLFLEHRGDYFFHYGYSFCYYFLYGDGDSGNLHRYCGGHCYGEHQHYGLYQRQYVYLCGKRYYAYCRGRI